jgi:putative ABC transport system ATP-binding protein
MTSPVVSLEGVSKWFGDAGGERVPVITDLALNLAAGEKASLIGPSGSGKSTLLALIAGLLTPDSGSVSIAGETLEHLGDGERARLRAELVGIALQSDNLIPFLTALENVEMALAFQARPSRRGDARRQAGDILERFGVGHRAGHLPRRLSGGEAQRVALAVAMVHRPRLLLADEVVAQLDDVTAGQVVDEVLADEFTVLYVTHDVDLADRAESRYELVEGRLSSR